MAVDLLVDALTGVIRGVPTNIDIDVLVDLNVKVFSDAMTDLGSAVPNLFEGFCF